MSSSISDASIVTLLTQSLAQTWQRAVASKTVITFDSTLHVQAASSDPTSGVPWNIRCVPALAHKPKQGSTDAKQDKQDQATQKDVFAPPYVDDMLVTDTLGDFVVLLNKYAIVPQHFLLVTREFVPQTLPPSPDMLALAYRIVGAYKSKEGEEEGTELLAFYNCVAESGASQPHCHVQFVESKAGVPVEVALLDKCVDETGRDDAIFALPLPYQHFVALLNPSRASEPSYIIPKLLALLDSLFKAKQVADLNDVSASEAEANGGAKRKTSYNLLLTKRALHLIPRSRGEVELSVNEEVRILSINSMAFAGHLLTKSIDELEALKNVEGGIAALLARAGCAGVADVTMKSEVELEDGAVIEAPKEAEK